MNKIKSRQLEGRGYPFMVTWGLKIKETNTFFISEENYSKQTVDLASNAYVSIIVND